MSKIVRVCLAVLALAALAVGQETATYKVVQRLPLTQQADGLNGELQLLLDSRMTPAMTKHLWNVGPWDIALKENSTEYGAFSTVAPLNAKLQISDNNGKPIWQKVLDYPLAKVKAHTIYSQHLFFVTVDDSAGFGSYSGLRTTLFSVVNRKLEELQAVDSKNSKHSVYLGRTLKTDWKMIPHGAGFDFLVLSCRPEAKKELAQLRSSNVHPSYRTDTDFVLHYVRYRFDGKQWIKYERTRRGFWESEQGFPPESSFPQ